MAALVKAGAPSLLAGLRRRRPVDAATETPLFADERVRTRGSWVTDSQTIDIVTPAGAISDAILVLVSVDGNPASWADLNHALGPRWVQELNQVASDNSVTALVYWTIAETADPITLPLRLDAAQQGSYEVIRFTNARGGSIGANVVSWGDFHDGSDILNWANGASVQNSVVNGRLRTSIINNDNAPWNSRAVTITANQKYWLTAIAQARAANTVAKSARVRFADNSAYRYSYEVPANGTEYHVGAFVTPQSTTTPFIECMCASISDTSPETGDYAEFDRVNMYPVTAPIFVAQANGTGANADPPNCAPGIGSADFVWWAVRAADGASAPTANPTSYSSAITGTTHANAAGASLHLARRDLTASSENPGAFTAPAAGHVAITIGLRPASSGAGGGGGGGGGSEGGGAPAPVAGDPWGPAYGLGDMVLRPTINMAMPARGSWIDEPQAPGQSAPFTQIKRITDGAVCTSPGGPGYSIQDPWSKIDPVTGACYLWLYNAGYVSGSPDHSMHDGNTGDFIRKWAPPGGDMHWSRERTNAAYCVDFGSPSRVLETHFDAASGTGAVDRVIFSFTGNVAASRPGGGSGVIQHNLDRIALITPYADRTTIRVLDLGNPVTGRAAAVIATKEFIGAGFGGHGAANITDAMISPLGNYLCVVFYIPFTDASGDGHAYQSGVHVFRIINGTLQPMAYSPNTLGGGGRMLTAMTNHMTLALTEGGHECMIAVGQLSLGYGTYDLATAAFRTELPDERINPTGHVNGYCPGWGCYSHYDQGAAFANPRSTWQQLVLDKLAAPGQPAANTFKLPGQIRHSANGGGTNGWGYYEQMSFAAIRVDGQRIVHRTNMGDFGGRVDAFLLAPKSVPTVPGVSRSFTEITGDILNPDRGTYQYVSVVSDPAGWPNLRSNGRTLAFSYIELDAYKNTSTLPQSLLDNVARGLQGAITAGIRFILRCAYSRVDGGQDAPIAIVRAHIAQLVPILTANKGGLALMHAGFFGPWGEWHSGNNNLGHPANLQQIINDILLYLASDRFCAIRTPSGKMAVTGTAPLTVNTAYSGSSASRLAHHNDGFLASADDAGTYYAEPLLGLPAGATTAGALEQFVNDEAKWTPFGGETSTVYSTKQLPGSTALAQFAAKCVTYLNSEYNADVLASWVTDGVWPELARRLGYRLTLLDAVLPNSAARSTQFLLSVRLRNLGFAAPCHARPVYFVLDGPQRLQFQLQTDVRRWLPGGDITLSGLITLQAGISTGNYTAALWIPDALPALQSNHKFAIRLANTGVWSDSTGLNTLGTLTVT